MESYQDIHGYFSTVDYIPVIFLLKVYSEQRLFSVAVCSSKCELTMWRAFCLLMLVLTSECVRGEREQFRSKLPRDSEGPKEQRIEKIPPCVHDEVLYCISCMGVFSSQIDLSSKLIIWQLALVICRHEAGPVCLVT